MNKENIDLDKLKLEHFKAYMLIRKVAEIGLKGDSKKGVNSKALAEWLHIIDTAIRGERLAIGMKYSDLNVGIEELIKMGYVVLDNTEDDLVRTCLDNKEIKVTSEMLKDFYKNIMQQSTNGTTSSKNSVES